MKATTSLIIGIQIFASMGFANAKVIGNGGDAIVCANKVSMLDKYEAKALRGYKLDLGTPSDSVDQKIQVAVDRLRRVDPHRAAVAQTWAKRFLTSAKFVRNTTLRDVDDSDQVFVPEGCHLEQIAIQNAQVVTSDPFFIVNADLWDHLNNDDKAILALHEGIFVGARGLLSSPSVRFYNSMGFTSAIDNMSQNDFYQMVFNIPVLHQTVVGGVGRDGRWYYQAFDWSFVRFVTAKEVNVSKYTDIAREFCGSDSIPATSRDLGEIRDAISDFVAFTNVTDYKTMDHRTVFVVDTPQMPVAYDVWYSKAPQKAIDQNKGEVWCVSNKNPFISF